MPNKIPRLAGIEVEDVLNEELRGEMGVEEDLRTALVDLSGH